MPDYNLGRAHGEIVITADTRGADQAAVAMGATAVEAEALDKSLGKVKTQFGETSKEAQRATAIVEQNRGRVSQLRGEYDRLGQSYQKAYEESKRLNKAWADLSQLAKHQEVNLNDVISAKNAAQEADRKAADILEKLNTKHIQYASAISNVTTRLSLLGPAHRQAERDVESFGKKIGEANEHIEKLAETISKTLSTALHGIGQLGDIGMAGGALGLLGGGAGNALVSGMSAVVEVIQQFSGAVLLLPAAVGGAVTALGTLAVGFHGVGEALSAMDDPTKFAQALYNLAPAAADAVRTIASFESAFKGAMREVQQSLSAPIVRDIQPLIQTWLPALMRAGQLIAGVFGDIAHEFLAWTQQPQVMAQFQSFIANMANALRALLPAIQPIANAFLTLTTVGSQAFGRLSEAVVKLANEFNGWVQNAASNGDLTKWINTALNAFTSLAHIAENVWGILANIAKIGDTFGGGFLGVLDEITGKLKEFTESREGQEQISEFFSILREAGHELGPIIKIVAGGVGELVKQLLELGVAIAPGIEEFLKDLAGSIKELGENFVKSAPSFNTFLKGFGELMKEFIESIGPQLPNLFRALVQALIVALPTLDKVIEAIAKLMGHLTPREVEVIALVAASLWGLHGALSAIAAIGPAIETLAAGFDALVAVFTSPITLAIVGIVALVGAFIYAYTHVKSFHDAVNGTLKDLKDFAGWVGREFVNAWHSVTGAISNAISSIKNFQTEAHNTLANLGGIISSEIGKVIAQAENWGRSIVQRLIDGIKGMFHPLGDAWSWLLKAVRDQNPSSPPKTGPLSGQGDPLVAGQNVADRFATGLKAGTPGVSSAYSAAIGSGASTFQTAGQTASVSGGADFTQGRSGFDQWINSLTQDLSAWSSILQHSFKLFQDVAGIFSSTAHVVANLWGGGDNPLTRPGGLFGPPKKTGQQHVDGVPDAPEPKGVAPDQYGKDLAGAQNTVPQQSVAGVPNAKWWGSNGTVHGQSAPATQGVPWAGSNGSPPAANAPAANVSAPGLSDNQKKISGQIISEGRKRGMSDEQIQAALAIASGESNLGDNQTFNTSGGNASVGGVGGVYQQAPKYYGGKDNVMDPNIAIPAFFDRYQNALNKGLDPLQAAVNVQNPQLGTNNQSSTYYRTMASHLGQAQGILGGAQPQVGLASHDIPLNGPTGNTQGQAPPNGPQPGQKYGVSLGAPESYGLPGGTNTGGYGSGGAGVFPQWLLDMGKKFGVTPSTYPGHQESERSSEPGYAPNPQHLNRGVDWVGTPAQMEAFAQAMLQAGAQGAVEQVIYRSQGGKEYGFGGGKDVSGHYYPQSGEGSYDEHATSPTGQGGHVHTRFSRSFSIFPEGEGAQTQGQAPPGTQGDLSVEGTATAPNAAENPIQRFLGLGDNPYTGPPVNLGNIDQGKILTDPAHTYKTPDGNVYNWVVGQGWVWAGGPKGSPPPPGVPKTPIGAPPVPGAGVFTGNQGNFDGRYPGGLPPGQGPGLGQGATQPLAPQTSGVGQGTSAYQNLAGGPLSGTSGADQGQTPAGSQKSPMDTFSDVMSGVGTIAGDAFQVFDDTIKSIGAAANITDQLVRGFANTQDVVGFITQMQTFITTAADVAKLVGDTSGTIGQFVGAGAAGDPSGATSAVAAAFGAVSAIAGVVNQALVATNDAIDLGKEVYKEVGKYSAIFAGYMLGGADTGPLGGNVRMLLNTNTGQLISYSQDNPNNKSVKNLPAWLSNAYGGNTNVPQNPQLNQLNIYAGPGQSTRQMLSDSMWIVSTGGPAVSSVAGRE
jgi:phage-related protein